MVEVNIEELVKACNLSFDEASQLIGKTSTQGRILGVTGKPGLGYAEGTYLSCSLPNEQTKHYRVGK